MSENKHISDKELKDSAPTLFGMTKTNVEAPKGYFESLADEVMVRIDKDDTPVIPLTRKNKSNLFLYAAAAGAAVLMGLFIFNGTNTSDLDPLLSFSRFEVEYEQDLDYLLAIDEDIVMEVYAEMDTDSDAEIEFLLDEGMDYDDFLNLDL